MPSRRRVLTVGLIVLVIALLAILPPLINVNRYRRNIATSISRSLGRPVRIDNVTLNLLPMPGFTLTNFVVGEDPAFGAEPVIFANSVRVTLRPSSLWHRRVEFSRITLDAPSVNLVHLPDGRWNLESILIQAARMPAAPTAQKARGDAPRFPYISASSARVNLKMGLEKMPISLTDADFSLWLPEPLQWHLRLEGHPARTDAAATDTGTVRLDGTLGKAGTLARVPISLAAQWSAAPLGAVSTVLMGHDAHLRGELTLNASVAGTVGRNLLTTRVQLAHLRRADFVPDQTLSLDLRCTAAATALFHALEDLHCTAPPTSAAALKTPGFALQGSIPDVFYPASAAVEATLTAIPAAALLAMAHVASPRLSNELTASGTLDADVTCCQPSLPPTPGALPHVVPGPYGSVLFNNLGLTLRDTVPFLNNVSVPGKIDANSTQQLSTLVIPIDLGAASPAQLTLSFAHAGYAMLLQGPALPSRLAQFATAIPQFGEGLEAALPRPLPSTVPSAPPAPEEPLNLDLTATRPWFGPQVWAVATPPPTSQAKHRPKLRVRR